MIEIGVPGETESVYRNQIEKAKIKRKYLNLKQDEWFI